MKFDNYSDHPIPCNRHGYFDKSCKFFVSLYSLYGFPTSMCYWNRTFCLGKFCDSFESILENVVYVQLEIPFDYA